MRRVLIKPYGFMGDCLFASSVARKLKEANMFDVVDFVVGLRQAEELLRLNPYIDNVFRTGHSEIAPLHNITMGGYDKEIQLRPTVMFSSTRCLGHLNFSFSKTLYQRAKPVRTQ